MADEEVEPTFDFGASARYVAEAFIDESQLKAMHKTLSSRWSELNSLSAALRLMKAHGVELSEDEERSLQTMDEGEQISTLVGKMPTQSNDEFQHFFLKLQLLVSTATRLREALEEGESDVVAQAMEDAEATGVSQHLLRVAIVQAGSQVTSMTAQMKQFGKEAEAKMGQLIRGQQDCVAAQKRLAHATEMLSRRGRDVKSKRTPIVLGFCGHSESVLVSMVFQAWARTAQRSAMEARIEEEFKERLQELEDRQTAWKMKQIQNTRGVMLKQIVEENDKLTLHVFELWKIAAEESKFEREQAGKVEEFEKAMREMQAVSLDLAKKAVQRWFENTDTKIMEFAWQAWLELMNSAREEEGMKAVVSVHQERSDNFGVDMLEKSKKFLFAASASSDSTLRHMTFQAWQEVYTMSKRAEEFASIIQERQGELSIFASRTRMNGGSAMKRFAVGIQEMDLLRVLGSWRKYAQMEKCMRKYHSRIDAKRQQLQGVQNMFRTFAKELDKNYTRDSSTSAVFEQSDRKHHRRAERGDRMSPKSVGATPKSLGEQGKCVSLPALRDASRPGPGEAHKGKAAHRAPVQVM